MKKSIILGTLISFSFLSNAQKSFTINENGGPSVNCDAISVNTETNIYEFTGNVNFQTEDIVIEKAEKIILNTKTKKVTAIGCDKITMKNTNTISVNLKCQQGNIEYKLGSKKFVATDCS